LSKEQPHFFNMIKLNAFDELYAIVTTILSTLLTQLFLRGDLKLT